MSTTASPGTATRFTPAPDITRARAGALPSELRRIASLDIVRGAVMVLMAIDHVRVFSGLPAGGPTPGIFFTRWVTHFCAPTFVFLAGTGAYLFGQKVGDRAKLSRFLLVRGAWLVLLELTVLRVGWTFNFDYSHYLLAGVIWMIGWCMVLMAGLVYLPVPAIGTLGVSMIVGHNLMDRLTPSLLPALSASPRAWLWQTLYYGGPVKLGQGGPVLAVLYVIVPWIGVMAAGYAFGPVMRSSPERRKKICLRLGAGGIIAFLVLRGFNIYGDPRPWSAPSALAFLSTTKYPASLLYLLMTLGPMLVGLALLERARGAVADVLEVFGRVPFFYYILHIPLIHLAAVLVSLIRDGHVTPWLMANHPMMAPPPPPGYTWSLPLLYLVTAVVVTILYFPCRWYANLRMQRRSAWLSLL